MKNRKLASLALIVVLLALSCKKPSQTTGNTFNSNVLILSQTQLSTLVAIDSADLFFPSGSDIATQTKVGYVLVGSISNLATSGFARKVVAITNSGGSVKFQTIYATLDDIYASADINFSVPVQLADTLSRTSSSIEFNEFTHDFNYTFGTSNSISLTGKVDILPTLNFSYHKSLNTASYGEMTIKIQDKSQVAISGAGTSGEWVIPLKSWKLKPLVVWVGFLPIVLTNKLNITAKLSASGKFIYSVTDNSTITGGVKITGSTLERIYIPEPSTAGQDPIKTNFDISATASAQIGVDIMSKFWDWDSLRNDIGVDIGLGGTISSNTPNYTLQIIGNIHDTLYVGKNFDNEEVDNIFGINISGSYFRSYPFSFTFKQGNWNDTVVQLTAASNNPVIGDVFHNYRFTTPLTPGDSGQNVTWDFTSITGTVNGDISYVSPGSFSFNPSYYDPSFSVANMVQTNSLTMGSIGARHYYLGDTTGLYYVGYLDLQDYHITYTPSLISLKYPVTFGSSFQRSSDWKRFMSFTLIYNGTINQNVVCDGIGTLKMPYGIIHNAFRLHDRAGGTYTWYSRDFHSPLLVLNYVAGGSSTGNYFIQ